MKDLKYFAFNGYGCSFGKTKEEARDVLKETTITKIEKSGYKNPLDVFNQRCIAFGLVDVSDIDVPIWTDDYNAYRGDTNEILEHSVVQWEK